MATAIGMINGGSSWIHATTNNKKRLSNGVKGNNRRKMGLGCSAVAASYSPLTDQYKTLRIQPGASEKDVKKAFRQLALQYHPDVCRGNDCGVQFHMINEAYDILMRNLRGEATENFYQPSDHSNGGSSDGGDSGEEELSYDDGDLWEEWMGWEGAGIRDYSSHINPYI